MIKIEAEKFLKYKDHTMETQSMWNVKTKVIPVSIGAIGTYTRSLRKYLKKISGNHEINEVQKTAILGTSHILREILMLKYGTFNMGNNIKCTINCNYRIAATLHTLVAPVSQVHNCKHSA